MICLNESSDKRNFQIAEDYKDLIWKAFLKLGNYQSRCKSS